MLAGAAPAAEMPPGRSGLYPGQYASGSGGTVSSNVASQVLSRLRPDISKDWWREVQKDLSAGEYHVSRNGEGLQAPNRDRT